MKKLVSILVFSVLFLACNHDDGLQETNNTIVNSNKRGESKMLKFNSEEELERFILEKVESKVDLIDESKRELEREGRLSLLLTYTLEKKEAERLRLKKENIPVVETYDNMLLYLLNENGEISINDFIFKIDEDFVYSYRIGHSSKINEFLEAYNAKKIKIESEKVTSFGEGLSVYKHNNAKNIETKIYSKSGNSDYHSEQFNGANVRFVAKNWTTNFWFYHSIGASTEVQKENKFLWWSWYTPTKADNRLKYNVTFTVEPFFGLGSASTLTKTGNVYCNCNKASKTIHWTVKFSEDSAYSKVKGTSNHWAHWYSSNPNTLSKTLNF
ncbi:hypothetical protein [Aquimarina longa]|uniref:hypothetical protein n=1 Tax=Aquimarina longa TaxID=1080221 RepID=UPI00078435DE|nr:hypothetical protein [Aquimarina longa]